ncbi:MAG TPA: PTS fructose transporter subunit IIA [Burkholderiaceae bacterium]
MAFLLLVAHAPLASALKSVAEHSYPDCAPRLAVLDVTPEMSADDVEVQARALLGGAEEALVLTDVFGATPSNGAQRLAAPKVRVVSGVNVPMLWRCLCYSAQPVDVLAERAAEGGTRGIVPAGIS